METITENLCVGIMDEKRVIHDQIQILSIRAISLNCMETSKESLYINHQILLQCSFNYKKCTETNKNSELTF